MISKLRIKFIAISMLSMLAVLALIIAGINILNYLNSVSDADETLRYLAANSGDFPALSGYDRPDGDRPPPGDDNMSGGWGVRPPSHSDMGFGHHDGRRQSNDRFSKFEERMSPEFPFESRYFYVLYDSGCNLCRVNTDRISAVDTGEAVEYAAAVLQSDSETGFADSYRYLRSDTEDGNILVVFLDCGRTLDTNRSFLTTSLLTSAAGLLAVFLLIYFFSGWVFAPVAESYEKQKRFITDAGHEIKTPLAIISADADVLGMDLGEDNEWLGDIKKQVTELTGLTNDLVYLSKMEESGAQLSSADFDISAAAEDVAASFRLVARSQGKTFETEVQPSVTMRGDEKTVRRLLSILLDNAVKYSPEGGTVRIRLEQKNKGVMLSVYNTSSTPVPQESLDKLFDRFYRTDPSRNSQTGGHGIGLSVAKAITLAHHGRIYAVSEDGRSLEIIARLFNL